MSLFNCEECGKSFTRKFNLNRHIEYIHGKDDDGESGDMEQEEVEMDASDNSSEEDTQSGSDEEDETDEEEDETDKEDDEGDDEEQKRRILPFVRKCIVNEIERGEEKEKFLKYAQTILATIVPACSDFSESNMHKQVEREKTQLVKKFALGEKKAWEVAVKRLEFLFEPFYEECWKEYSGEDEEGEEDDKIRY